MVKTIVECRMMFWTVLMSTPAGACQVPHVCLNAWKSSFLFNPYAAVSGAILSFTKTNSGGTDHVWFYDMQADGKSLDDKRTDLLPPEKQGPKPTVKLT